MRQGLMRGRGKRLRRNRRARVRKPKVCVLAFYFCRKTLITWGLGLRGEERKAKEHELDEKRDEMTKNKQVDAVKRYSYLLGQTELFRHFVDMKVRLSPSLLLELRALTNQNRKRVTQNMLHG